MGVFWATHLTTWRSFCSQSRSNSRDKPRITITRAPTIDQSNLEFLYPSNQRQNDNDEEGDEDEEDEDEEEGDEEEGAEEDEAGDLHPTAPPTRRRSHVFVNLDGYSRKRRRSRGGQVLPDRSNKKHQDVRITFNDDDFRSPSQRRLREFSVALALSKSHGDFSMLLGSPDRDLEEPELKMASSLADIRNPGIQV